MGGLRRIFEGMSAIMAAEEENLGNKIEEMVNQEKAGDPTDTEGAASGAGSAVAGGDGQQIDGTDASTSEEGLATAKLIALQYDVQRFSIFNNITTS